MDAEFWHQRWQENQIGFHQQEMNSHLQQFWPRLGLAQKARVFVPLCGKSRDMLWLLNQGYSVLGIEISPLAVAAFFVDNGLTPERTKQGPFERWTQDALVILCGDFFALRPSDLAGVAGVYDRASLIALPPQMRQSYARHMAAVLTAGTRMLLVTMEYPQHEMQGPPFSVRESEVERLFRPDFALQPVFRIDILSENPGFRGRGMTQLEEQVYLLERKQANA